MKVTVLLCVLLCYVLGINGLIIPDELPSLLSVIYSNIPVIKKGTDSRVGWGFRLGDRADFQVLLELGPQKYTEPLGNQQPKDKGGNSKRNTLESLADTLYGQNQALKKLTTQHAKEQSITQKFKQEKEKKDLSKKPTDTVTNSESAKWLTSWSDNVKKPTHGTSKIAKPGLGIGEIDARSVLPADDYDQLDESNNNSKTVAASSPKVTSTTSKEDALDNVNLE